MAQFFDDFNRADEVLDDSPDWTNEGSSSPERLIHVVSGQAEMDDTAGHAYGRWTQDTDGDDQFAEAIVTHVGDETGQRANYVTVRGNGATGFSNTETYMWGGRKDNGDWRIRRRSGGSFVTIGTHNEAVPDTPFTMRFEAEGNELRGYINGQLKLIVTDSTFSGSTHRRVGIQGNDNPFATFDEFSAGDLVEEPPPEVAAIAPPVSAQVI